MKIGLLFGTFNPIHNGHLAIAEYMACKTDLNQVWLIVSPQNPFKIKQELLEDKSRLRLVELALKNKLNIKPSSIEFNLPKPSYTINTLLSLKKNHPNDLFVIIMGEDNLRSFPLWKEYEKILSGFQIYVYPRKFTENENQGISGEIVHPNILKFDLDLLDISSTEIRRRIKNREDVSEFLPEEVWEEIKKKNYYF